MISGPEDGPSSLRRRLGSRGGKGGRITPPGVEPGRLPGIEREMDVVGDVLGELCESAVSDKVFSVRTLD